MAHLGEWKKSVAALVFCGLGSLASPAIAADLGPAPVDQAVAQVPSQWEFRFTPYAWATAITGDATVSGQTVNIDASFIDIVEESDSIVALMGFFQARRGRLALYADTVWSQLSFSGERAGTGPLGLLDLSAEGQIDYEQLIIEAGVAYEIASFSDDSLSLKAPVGETTSFTAVDLLFAARYWRQELGVTFDIQAAGVLPPGFELEDGRVIGRSGSIEWVDPVVGVRVRHQFSPGQELQLRGDIGGFGVGSDFSWQLFGAYSFALCDSCSGVIGYRALSVDYSEEGPNGRRGIDATQHGPVLGVNFRW